MASLFAEKQNAIVERWIALTLNTYPPEAAKIFARERDRFRNPIGFVVRRTLITLLNQLLAEEIHEEPMRQALDELIRIRAVQKFSASQAAGFPLLLKRAVQEVAADADPADLSQFFEKIDRLALMAFDVYAQCREQLFQIRMNEVCQRQATPRSLGKANPNCGACPSQQTCS